MEPVNPIKRWVRLVETNMYEIGVTLVVHRVVITGARYKRYGR